MMMRVSQIEGEPGTITLRLEGRLTSQTAADLEEEYRRVAQSAERVTLQLEGLQFADGPGIAALQRCEQDGAILTGSSALVGALLRAGGPTREASRSADEMGEHERHRVARLRAGEEAAFEEIVREYSGRLLATARRMTGNEDDARDAVQDAFLSMHRGLASFEGSARLSTWLHRIVVNACLMKLRSRRRKREDSIDDLLPRFAEDGHFANRVSEWDATAHAGIERRELRDMVRRAIDKLPEAYRIVLVLRDMEDYDTDETAEALGIGINAVKTRLHRARQALRTLIEQERRV